MQVINELVPTDPARIEQLMQQGPNGPIYMVNLLKFKERAAYEDGRQTELSGREAYMIYGCAVNELLPKFGGQGLFAGDVTFLMLGKVEELWDEIAIASYPNRRAIVEMSMSKAWKEIAVHRTAGLAGQLNIETVAGTDFDTKKSDFLQGLSKAVAP